MRLAFGAAVLGGAVANAGISLDTHTGSDEMLFSPCDEDWRPCLTVIPASSAGGRPRFELTFKPGYALDLPPPPEEGPTAVSTPGPDPTTFYNLADDTPVYHEHGWGRRPGLVVIPRRPPPSIWVWRPTWAPPVPAAMQPYPFAVPAPAAAEILRDLGFDLGAHPPSLRVGSRNGWAACGAALLWIVAAMAGVIAAAAAWRAARKRRSA